MSGKLIAAGLLGVGCIAAATVGGYVALRSNAADLRPTTVAEVAPAGPVTETAPEASAPTPLAASAPTTTATAAPADVVPPPARRAPVAGSSSSAAAAPASPSMGGNVPAADTTPSKPVETPATEPTAVAQPASAAPTSTPAPATANASSPAPARYDEVTVASDSVLGLRLESTISTETARVEDRVQARLSRDVLVDGRVAIPSGARLEGTVTMVERGGKFKDRPRLGIAFNTLVLSDNTRVAIRTETIFRDGESPSGQVNAKVGGSAVVGAILGAMIGGKKGAALGGAAGAAGGAAAVAAGARPEALLVSGSPLTVRLTAAVTVLIERENHD